jgi:hypothetical protein
MAASPHYPAPLASSSTTGHELLCLYLKSFYGLESTLSGTDRGLVRGGKPRRDTMFQARVRGRRKVRPVL